MNRIAGPDCACISCRLALGVARQVCGRGVDPDACSGLGLFAYLPLATLSIAGVVQLVRTRYRLGLWMSGMVLMHWALVGIFPDWRGGLCPPLRYWIPVAALFAAPCAAILAAVRAAWFRATAVALMRCGSNCLRRCWPLTAAEASCSGSDNERNLNRRRRCRRHDHEDGDHRTGVSTSGERWPDQGPLPAEMPRQPHLTARTAPEL